jgi:hypothetical protein
MFDELSKVVTSIKSKEAFREILGLLKMATDVTMPDNKPEREGTRDLKQESEIHDVEKKALSCILTCGEEPNAANPNP